MLSKSITAKLNEQINLELYSSNVYLQMSAWCHKHGYEGCSICFLLCARIVDYAKVVYLCERNQWNAFVR